MKQRLLCLMLLVSLAACDSGNSSTREDVQSLQSALAEQQAIESIRNLFADYGRTLDERDYETFGELYSEDAVYIGGGGEESIGPEAIALQLETVISANATGANLHFYSNERIEIGSDNKAATAVSRGAFYVQDENGSPMPLIFATYNDAFVLTEQGWKFSRREVVGDIPGPSNESRYLAE